MKAARGSGETGGCRFPHNTPLTSYWKGCRCPRCRDHNSQRAILWRDKYSKVNLEILKARKQACADCGWNKIPSVLEFHHVVVDPSNRTIRATATSAPLSRFLRELDKGVFLCPNCHRCRHYDPVNDQVDTQNNDLR